jgi:phenylacetate-CoA ligase
VGYHVRENDLFLEIIDPASGGVLPQGEWGEIVVTTLTPKNYINLEKKN